MNKKTLILIILSISVHTNNAMMTKMKCHRSRSYCYERPKIEKILTYRGIFHPDFPKEIDMNIVRFIATNTGGETLQEAAQIFNALTCANRFLHDYMNDSERTLGWIKDFSRKFEDCPNILVARMLWTKEARRRYALQESFLVGWTSPGAAKENNFDALKKMGIDLEFSYAGLCPTPFLEAICWHAPGIYDVKKWLVDNGANVNACTPERKNAFMLLCNDPHDSSREMDLILNHKNFNINHQDNAQNTALHELLRCSILRRWPTLCEITERLLEKGADPTIKNGKGKTPLDLAQKIKCEELIDLLQNVAVEFASKNPEEKS